VDIRSFNREAWNRQVSSGNRWTVPVSPEVIASAKEGNWSVLLTPTRPVPQEWFPTISGLEVLCLASGGGQQGPVLAAAGAKVTVFDNSPDQLEQDRMVAARDGLEIQLVEGDMVDLSFFSAHSFDLIFHPVSNVFIPAIKPVWLEAFRVMKPGGVLLAGFVNPLQYIFDLDLLEAQGELIVKHKIPYSDLISLSEVDILHYKEQGSPLEFGHTLEDQIGGQLEAGFLLDRFYEDIDPTTVLGNFIPSFIATRAIKP
jgi:SAM-dependent methyltransferase